MQEYQIDQEEAAIGLSETLTEQAWAEIEEKMMCALRMFIEELLEEELSQGLGAKMYESTEAKDIFGITVSARTVSKTTAFLDSVI